jgi:hypothetical protein
MNSLDYIVLINLNVLESNIDILYGFSSSLLYEINILSFILSIKLTLLLLSNVYLFDMTTSYN